MAERPLLSIIITSYTLDRLKDISELLDSIKAQTYDYTETILVVERSVELFSEVKRYAVEKTIPNVKVVFNYGEPGLSSARNLGIKEARGEIIAFIDDDALPFPDWAEEIVKTYDDDSVIATTGPVLPLWEGKSADWFPKEFDWILGGTDFSDMTEKQEVRNVWGMNMSFRKEAFDLAGTFSASIGGIQGQRLHGEEVELSLRIKRKTKRGIAYNPKVRVKHKMHEDRLTSRFTARSSYWIGYTKHMLKKLYPEGDEGKNILSVEHQLLKHIFARFFPETLRGFFLNPVIAWHKLSVAFVALFFVALGYFSYWFQSLLNRRKTTIYN